MSPTPFSRNYFPPAPVLRVQLCVPDREPSSRIHSALIDTGADGTMAPLSLLEQLGAPVTYMVAVRAHIGDYVHYAAAYQVDLVIDEQFRLPAIDVVSDDWGDEIILGRNVLNKLRLLLNGRSQLTELLD